MTRLWGQAEHSQGKKKPACELWIENQIQFWPNFTFQTFCFKNTTSGFVCFLNGDLGSICIRPGTLQIQRSKYDRLSPAQCREPASFIRHWEMVNGASAGATETGDWPPRWHDDSKWAITKMQGHLRRASQCCSSRCEPIPLLHYFTMQMLKQHPQNRFPFTHFYTEPHFRHEPVLYPSVWQTTPGRP